MSQLTGRVFISINGQKYRSKEGASLDVGGLVREAATSDSGVDGFVEKYTQAAVDFAINHKPEISLTAIHSITDGTLLFQTDTGSVFTLREAWSATPPKLVKGEVSLRFESVECIEG